MDGNISELKYFDGVTDLVEIKTSFLIIAGSDYFDSIVAILDYYKRDYDILNEPLGIFIDLNFEISSKVIYSESQSGGTRFYFFR